MKKTFVRDQILKSKLNGSLHYFIIFSGVELWSDFVKDGSSLVLKNFDRTVALEENYLNCCLLKFCSLHNFSVRTKINNQVS